MPLLDAQQKVKRAKKFLQELKDEINEFHATKPYRVIEEKIDEEFSALKLRFKKIFPREIKAILGDLTSNLRASLDLMVCELAKNNGRGISGIYFPTAESKQRFDSNDVQEIIRNLSDEAKAFINGLEPYKGGKHQLLWVLNKLEIVNKHRALINIGSNSTQIRIDRMNMPVVTGLEIVPPRWDAEDESLVLLKMKEGTVVEYSITVNFFTGFRDIELIEGVEIVSVCTKLIEEVEDILNCAANNLF